MGGVAGLLTVTVLCGVFWWCQRRRDSLKTLPTSNSPDNPPYPHENSPYSPENSPYSPNNSPYSPYNYTPNNSPCSPGNSSNNSPGEYGKKDISCRYELPTSLERYELATPANCVVRRAAETSWV